jgi:TDG/mug DNA glycosylase family protein
VGLRLVICGTAASPESARKRQYYAGPGNRFWAILHETGITDCRLEPKDFERLAEFGVGLTDVMKSQSGIDSDVDFTLFDSEAFSARILTARPRVLCFNGKKAAQVALRRRTVDYGDLGEKIGGTHLFVAPSTSGLAARWWNASVWSDLAELILE